MTQRLAKLKKAKLIVLNNEYETKPRFRDTMLSKFPGIDSVELRESQQGKKAKQESLERSVLKIPI